MGLRNILVGLMGASIISASTINCATTDYTQIHSNNKRIIGFENNNNSLDEVIREESEKTAIQVETRGLYKVETEKGDEFFSVRGRGSATIIDEINGDYYAITAHHVINLPGKLDYSDIEEDNIKNNTYLSNKDKGFREIKLKTFEKEINGEKIQLKDLELIGQLLIEDKMVKTLSSTTSPYLEGKLISRNVKLGNKYTAEIIASDENLDYALLKFPSDGKQHPLLKNKNLKLGNSDNIARGDYTCAIGYSLGFSSYAFSEGTASNINFPTSSKGKTILFKDSFMFTAPISPGNSGGQVYTIKNGQMFYVGIAVAHYISGQNMNIATKIDHVLKDLYKKGIYDFKPSYNFIKK